MKDLLKGLNRLRRVMGKLIDKDYIKKKIEKRKGKCNRCGECCKGCKYFKLNMCTVYNNRPWFCYKEFPLDKFDIWVFGVKKCGYKFK